MGIIRLYQMEFNVSHGYYREEKQMRQKFIVNLDIKTDLGKAAKSDQLSDTINYEDVYLICKKVLEEPVALIEHLAYKIKKELSSKYSTIESMTIEIQKRDVQLGGKLDYVSVILE